MKALTHAMQGRGAISLIALQIIAVAPPLAIVVVERGPPALIQFGAALLIVLAWDYAFAKVRHHRFLPQGLTTAAIFALLTPPDVPIWHVAVTLSLATVIGELVFGGRGFGFLSPATVALALALLSLPNLELPEPSTFAALACLPGLALLLLTGLCSLSVLLAFATALGAIHSLAAPSDLAQLALVALPAFVFLIADPTASAVTLGGRVLYGAVAGALVWVFGGIATEPATINPMIFAALTASLFAPLFDHVAISLQIRAGRLRHG